MVKEEIDKKSFVWSGLRISFYSMIAIWVISIITVYLSGINIFVNILSFLIFFLVIFTFVISIIHLNKYKKKAFAIAALVISSLIIIANILVFIISFIAQLNGINMPIK